MTNQPDAQTLRSRVRQRGAAAIEMAFLLVLVMVPLISAVNLVQDSGGSRIGDDGERIGSPREGYEYTTGTVTGGGPGSTLPPPTTAATVATANLATLATMQGSTKWTATVIITVLDAGGNAISGAAVLGVWTSQNTGNQDTTCVTDAAGRCTVTQWGLKATGSDIVTDTTYTISDVTGDGFTLDPAVIGTAATISNPAP